MSGQRNTHIKKDGPGYFFCPAKVHNLDGLPIMTTFDEFHITAHWQTELDETRQQKEEKERKEVGDGGEGVEEPWQHERVYVLNIYHI